MATRADVTTIVVLLAAVGALAPTALRGQDRKATQLQCTNHLRQLGLAAMQYSDDKRFFPHVGKVQELDGGYTTNASTKATRALMWYGYHADPEKFVCPATPDRALPIEDAGVKADLRTWFWAQDYGRASPRANPFVDGAADPALSATSELSYGWTRRGLNANGRHDVKVAADRSRANHGDGWNVLALDATVTWVGDPEAQAQLLSTTAGEPAAGFLGIQGPDDPAPAGR